MTDDTENYEIGYKKPPKGGQFKPGHSGNPKGRPKGSKSLITIVKENFDQKIQINENGKSKTVTIKEAIVKRFSNQALSGDIKALNALVGMVRGTSLLQEDIDETKSLIDDKELSELLSSFIKSNNKGNEND